MNFRKALDIAYQNHTDSLHQATYSTEATIGYCPICTEGHDNAATCWFLPHEVAKHMPEEEGFVCSGKCAVEWTERHWEEIEEFNALQAKDSCTQKTQNGVCIILLGVL